jgi:hypothetical protein
MTRMITEMGIGRARAQRSGARYRNRCALCGVGRVCARGWPRNDTDDHGMGFRVVLVLVLSAAVLVIVIDARAVGMARIGGPRNTRMTRKGDRGWRDRGDRAWLGILCGRWFWGRMVGRAFVGVCDGGCV